MANFLQRIISRFRKKPEAPKITPGHRGVALGLGTKPNEINRRTIESGEISEFVYEGQPLFVHSSNVAMAQYFKESKQIMVEYLDGEAWMFGNFSEQEAIAFAQAQSKGVFVWDVIRIRGTKHGHKKPATKLRDARK